MAGVQFNLPEDVKHTFLKHSCSSLNIIGVLLKPGGRYSYLNMLNMTFLLQDKEKNWSAQSFKNVIHLIIF